MRRPVLVEVITRLIVGGAQRVVLDLAAGLRDEYDVRIVTGPETGVEGSLHAEAAEIAPLVIAPSLRRDPSPRHDVRSVFELRRLFRALDATIVHTHSSKAGILGRLAASDTHARAVHTVHGWGHTPADPPLRRAALITLERAMARRCEALIAVSNRVMEEGLANGIGDPEQYVQIPDGIDYSSSYADFWAARTAARAAVGVPSDAEVIGWVGRFVDQKDPTVLADALTTLLERRPETWAVLVGDGPRRSYVENRLSSAGVNSRCRLVGVRPDVRQLFPAFDVLVHPSRHEGFPLVIQEGLAERVPVIASRVSGTDELVEDDVSGFVVAIGDSSAMAGATITALDSGLRAPLPIEVINRLAERNGSERVISAHRELFAGILRS